MISIFTILFIFSSQENKTDYVCKDCNVILISIDTLRADHLSSYGYFRDTSPNIDKIASKGILFKNAFSQSPITLPSHMSIFTGLYPTTHGVIRINEDVLQAEYKTLPEILKLYGYKTSWFAHPKNNHLNLSLGFGRGVDEIYTVNWKLANQWIVNNSNSTFFIFLHTSNVHDPYVPPAPYDNIFSKNYTGKIVGERKEFYTEFRKEYKIDVNTTDLEFKDVRKFFWSKVNKSDEGDISQLKALYDGSILFTDFEFGNLIETLRNMKILDKTVIIITADHGEEFGEHRDFLHESLYVEDLHVPLIIYNPKIKSHREISAQVQSIDIMPTILEMVGIEIPARVEGKSLKHLILGQTKKIHNYTYGYWIDILSISSDGWKFILNVSSNSKELYDIKLDPKEKVNLIADYPEISIVLENELKKWIDETGGEQVKEIKGSIIVYP